MGNPAKEQNLDCFSASVLSYTSDEYLSPLHYFYARNQLKDIISKELLNVREMQTLTIID